MSTYNILERLFQHPETAVGKYEEAIVQGMTFMADRLIWSEQYYIDAINQSSEITKENWSTRATDMYNIINDIIQDYVLKTPTRKIWEQESWDYYDKHKIGDK